MKCPTEQLIEQIGDRWKLHIVHQLACGPQRTQSLLAKLKGISSRTLSARLKALSGDGWITRRVYPEVPPRVEYELTAQGRALVPLLTALNRAGDAIFPAAQSDCPCCQALASDEPASDRQPPASRFAAQSRGQPERPSSSDDDVVLL